MTAVTADQAKAERWWFEAFEMSAQDYTMGRRGHVPLAYLRNALRIVDSSGIMEWIEQWDQLSRKNRAGRKADIPHRAVLVLFLLHIQEGRGVVYEQIADTLFNRLTDEEFALLGVRDRHGNLADWYHRFWRAAQRLFSLVDSRPAPRRARLTGSTFRNVLAARNTEECAEKLRRIDWVCNALVQASFMMMPKDLRERHRGNIAIDATRIDLPGRPNPVSDEYDRNSADPDAGRYRREGKHDGKGAAIDIPAYELEVATMTWNRPGETGQFPLLATAVGFHNPGKIRGAALKMLLSLHERKHPIGVLAADGAYLPGSKPKHLQIPARQLGWEFASRLGKVQMGQKAFFEDVIQVDGGWYVRWMPEELQSANHDAFHKTIDEETLRSRLAARDQYRMKPKGKPDADGHQRFLYPPVGSYMAFDPLTRKRIKPPKTAKTITIPVDQGAKRVQKFPYGTSEWQRWYAMRSTVESFNSTLKKSTKEDLDNHGKRRGRGFTYQYLVSTLAVVSANVRKLHDFISALDPTPQETQRRQARRAVKRDPLLPEPQPTVRGSAPL